MRLYCSFFPMAFWKSTEIAFNSRTWLVWLCHEHKLYPKPWSHCEPKPRWRAYPPAPGRNTAHWSLQSFHSGYLLNAACMSQAWCPLWHNQKTIFFDFLKLILCFHFTFEWLISIDLRNDSNNSVTCIESYTVFQ